PLGKIFTDVADLTIACDSYPGNHEGLQLQIHRNDKLVHAVDLAPGETPLEFPLSGLQPSELLRVAVVAVQGQPASSQDPSVELRLIVEPHGTHPKPRPFSWFAAWLSR